MINTYSWQCVCCCRLRYLRVKLTFLPEGCTGGGEAFILLEAWMCLVILISICLLPFIVPCAQGQKEICHQNCRTHSLRSKFNGYWFHWPVVVNRMDKPSPDQLMIVPYLNENKCKSSPVISNRPLLSATVLLLILPLGGRQSGKFLTGFHFKASMWRRRKEEVRWCYYRVKVSVDVNKTSDGDRCSFPVSIQQST